MANIFGVDVGGPPQVSAADTRSAVSGIEMGGRLAANAISFLGGLAGQTYTAVKDVNMEQQLRANKEAFTQFEAKQQLTQAQQGLQQALEQRGKLASGGQINKLKEQDELISRFSNETTRLEDALANKQISLGRYLGNVQALTKQWISQFPGRADEIRQQVGQLTGIKNADDFAYQTYLEREMSMQQQTRALAIEEAKRQAALEEKTAEDLYKNGFYPDRQTALREFRAGKATDAVFAVQRINQLDSTTQVLEKDIKNKNISADQKTAAAGSLAFVNASKTIITNDKQFAPIIAKLPQYKNPDGTWNLAKLGAARDELAPVVGQLTAAVRNSFEASAETLRMELISTGATNVDEKVKQIYAQGETFIKNLESTDSVLAMNTIDKLIANKRLSLKDSFESIQASSQLITAYQGSKFMGMYNDPSQREALKTQYPEVYSLLDTNLKNITGSSNQVQAMLGSSAVQQITNAEKDMSVNGQLPTTTTPAQAKQNSEVAEIVGKSALESLALRKEMPTQENANLTASYVQTAIQDRGPRLNSILKEEATIKAAIDNMPEGIRAQYLATINRHIENVISPQGQLANNVGILSKVRKSASETIPKDSNGNPQSLIKLQVDANGFITPLVEPNPAYKAPRGLLEGVTPQGKAPTSRTAMTTVPAPSARPSVYSIESNKEFVNVNREINNVVTIAAVASATERKAMAQRFVEAYNNAPTTSGSSSNDSNWFKSYGK
jgi:hypothetical protein